MRHEIVALAARGEGRLEVLLRRERVVAPPHRFGHAPEEGVGVAVPHIALCGVSLHLTSDLCAEALRERLDTGPITELG